MKKTSIVIGVASAALVGGAVAAPAAHAAQGWVAVASSISHEQLDWAYGPSRANATANALNQCSQLQQANDCIVLAVSSDCVAIAWDAAEPLNRPHSGIGGRPAVALQAAAASAGPAANDPTVRCA